MVISSSGKYVEVIFSPTHKTRGLVTLTLKTDLNAHAKLSVIPQQELEILLNRDLQVLTDSILPKIVVLAEKYNRGYSE